MIGTLRPDLREVTVVGGGIAGLLISYMLDREGYIVTLIEASQRLGGLIQTAQTPFGIAESAAHSLLVTEDVGRFFSELGVELVEVQPDSKARYILRNGRFRKIPLGFFEVMGVLFRVIFVRSSGDSLNLKEWAEKHLGLPALKYLITPFLRGVYGARPEEISVEAAFPRLQLSQGSTLFGSFFKKKKKSPSVMMSPRFGMESLVRALEIHLRKSLGDRLILGREMKTLPEGNLVLCVPAGVAEDLLRSVDLKLAAALSRVSYTPLVCATVFFKKEQVKNVPSGVGVLFPEGEEVYSLGILFNSSAFPNRATSHLISCTVMLGGSSSPSAVNETDETLRSWIEKDLQLLFGFEGHLEGCVIRKWKEAVPKYSRELLKVWNVAQQGWCAQPGHVLFGNYTGQVSLRGMIETVMQFKGSKIWKEK